MYKNFIFAKDKITKEMITFMLKQLAWNTFKNTGNIDTFMELVEVQNVEKNMERDLGNFKYGDNKNKGNSNFRK